MNIEKSKSDAEAVGIAKIDSTAGESVRTGEVKPKVHFNLLTTFGVQFSVTATPLALGTYTSLTIGVGGSAGYFWGFIFVGVFQLITCLAVAEVASAIPHSSGPAHWVIILAPKRYSRLLGYIMGWVTNCAWFCICCSSNLYMAQLILAIVQANHSDYIATAWHTYLVYVASAFLTLGINLPRLFKSLNALLAAGIFLINGTSLYLLIGLLVRAQPKQSAHDVFLKFINETGWKSNGTVFFIGLLPGMASLAAFDNATHLTDEVERPTKQIPQVLIGSFLLSFLTGLPMIMVYQFCNVDPLSLLTPVGGQPIVQLMINAFRSDAMSIIGTSLTLSCLFIAESSCLLSWSRLYWSFSREGALPFSRTMAKLEPIDSLPLNTLLWNTFLIIALGAISVGSQTAMNAFLGSAGILTISSLVTTFGLVIYRGSHSLNPERWFNLGRFSTPIMWISCLWSVFISVWLCMPLYVPVTPESMNYTSVVFVGFIALSGIYWVLAYSREGVMQHYHEGQDSQRTHNAPVITKAMDEESA
ncbi:hypothetical protein LTR84_008573 [Exophiala bonariae]|uniref:Amino acid permease/ SLC12A domain-containing protein n=1 Tax=Exophiala bonariae TaxID=1690606 RepID=A0AAV9MXC7_9EURO|nr:hypothetical protein LTR84_008573 [Exophiala bonariae]